MQTSVTIPFYYAIPQIQVNLAQHILMCRLGIKIPALDIQRKCFKGLWEGVLYNGWTPKKTYFSFSLPLSRCEILNRVISLSLGYNFLIEIFSYVASILKFHILSLLFTKIMLFKRGTQYLWGVRGGCSTMNHYSVLRVILTPSILYGVGIPQLFKVNDWMNSISLWRWPKLVICLKLCDFSFIKML